MAIIQFLNRNLIKDDHPIQLIFKESQTFELPKGYRFADICAVGGGAAGCPIFRIATLGSDKSYTSSGLWTRHGDHGIGGYVNSIFDIPISQVSKINVTVGVGGSTVNALAYEMESGYYYLNANSELKGSLWAYPNNPQRLFVHGGTASYVQDIMSNNILCYGSAAGGWTIGSPCSKPSTHSECDGWHGINQMGRGYFSSPVQRYNWPKYKPVRIIGSYVQWEPYQVEYYVDSGYAEGVNDQVYGVSKWLFNEPDTILFGQNATNFYQAGQVNTGQGGGGTIRYFRNRNGVWSMLTDNSFPKYGIYGFRQLQGSGGSGIVYMRLWTAANHNPAVYNAFYWKINTYLVQNGQLIPIEWDYNYR